MSHEHHEHGSHELPEKITRAFSIGIALNLVYVAAEAAFGLWSGSLALVSDAGHNLADVAGLALSMLAFRLLRSRPNKNYTYGYRKTTILAALANSVLLCVSIGAILYESFQRFLTPAALPGITIAVVAGIGILINSGSALLFMKDQRRDLNIRSAYLHLLADAGLSLAVVIGGITIYYTGWYWIDPLLSVLLCLVILSSTWALLKKSLRLSLDGVPEDIDMEAIRKEIEETQGVESVHHMHVWAMSTAENAATLHLVVERYEENLFRIKADIRHILTRHGIRHATLEIENPSDICEDIRCRE